MNKRNVSIIFNLDTKLIGRKSLSYYMIMYIAVGVFFAYGIRATSIYVFNYLLFASMMNLASIMFTRDLNEFMFINMTAVDIESYIIGKNISACFYAAIFAVISNIAFIVTASRRLGSGYAQEHVGAFMLCVYLLFISISIANYAARKNLMYERKTNSFLLNFLYMIFLGIALAAFAASIELISSLFAIVLLVPLSILIYLLSLYSTIEHLHSERLLVFDR